MKRPSRPRTYQKTILVADDSLLYRMCSRDVLHRAGYRVLTAQDADALLQTAAMAGEIDLLLAAEHLIDADDRELTRHFRDHQPNTPMLVMTEQANAVAFRKKHGRTVLRHPKPGHPAELIGIVAHILADGRPEAGTWAPASRPFPDRTA